MTQEGSNNGPVQIVRALITNIEARLPLVEKAYNAALHREFDEGHLFDIEPSEVVYHAEYGRLEAEVAGLTEELETALVEYGPLLPPGTFPLTVNGTMYVRKPIAMHVTKYTALASKDDEPCGLLVGASSSEMIDCLISYSYCVGSQETGREYGLCDVVHLEDADQARQHYAQLPWDTLPLQIHVSAAAPARVEEPKKEVQPPATSFGDAFVDQWLNGQE